MEQPKNTSNKLTLSDLLKITSLERAHRLLVSGMNEKYIVDQVLAAATIVGFDSAFETCNNIMQMRTDKEFRLKRIKEIYAEKLAEWKKKNKMKARFGKFGGKCRK